MKNSNTAAFDAAIEAAINDRLAVKEAERKEEIRLQRNRNLAKARAVKAENAAKRKAEKAAKPEKPAKKARKVRTPLAVTALPAGVSFDTAVIAHDYIRAEQAKGLDSADITVALKVMSAEGGMSSGCAWACFTHVKTSRLVANRANAAEVSRRLMQEPQRSIEKTFSRSPVRKMRAPVVVTPDYFHAAVEVDSQKWESVTARVAKWRNPDSDQSKAEVAPAPTPAVDFDHAGADAKALEVSGGAYKTYRKLRKACKEGKAPIAWRNEAHKAGHNIVAIAADDMAKAEKVVRHAMTAQLAKFG